MHRVRHPHAFLAEGLALVTILGLITIKRGLARAGQGDGVQVAAGAHEGAWLHRAVPDLEPEVESIEHALGHFELRHAAGARRDLERRDGSRIRRRDDRAFDAEQVAIGLVVIDCAFDARDDAAEVGEEVRLERLFSGW